MVDRRRTDARGSCEPEDSGELQDQHCKPELKKPVQEQRAAPAKDDPQASPNYLKQNAD